MKFFWGDARRGKITTDRREPLQIYITQFRAVRQIEYFHHVWWKRVMLFNMLEKEQREVRKEKNAQFLVSRGDDLEKNEEKYEKYIKFRRRTRTKTRAEEETWNYSSENENWWGEEKKNDECKNQKLFLCTRKIYFIPFAGCCCWIFGQFKSSAFWFAFNKIISWKRAKEKGSFQGLPRALRTMLMALLPWISSFSSLEIHIFAWLKTMLYLDDVSNCLHVEIVSCWLSCPRQLAIFLPAWQIMLCCLALRKNISFQFLVVRFFLLLLLDCFNYKMKSFRGGLH